MLKFKTIAVIVAVSLISIVVCPTDAQANEATFKSAVKLFKKKKYSDSLKKLEVVLKENPGDYRAYYFAGVCHKKLGKKRKAIQNFSKSMICGYKTRVYGKAAFELQHLDRAVYIQSVSIAQKRYKQRKAQQAQAQAQQNKSSSKAK